MGSGDKREREADHERGQAPTHALNEGDRIQATTQHTPTTPLDLDALRAMAGAATPLPWRTNSALPECIEAADGSYDVASADHNHGDETGARLLANAAFIVAACNATPALVEEVQALRDRLRDAEAQRDALLRGFESTDIEREYEDGDWTVFLATEEDGLGDRLTVAEVMHEYEAREAAAYWQALIDAARAGAAAKGSE